MTPQQQFDRHGALLVKDVVGKDMAIFFTHAMLRSPAYPNGRADDDQVPGAVGLLDHEVMFETLHERIWPAVEAIVGEELIPTYSYARVYANGNVLEKHTDRPACEVSMTVQLGRSHHYAWPIHMGGMRFDLAEGDGVIYRGCDVEHWRDRCDGPDGYISGQAFFHFVRRNGPHADWAGDRRWPLHALPYVRGRHLILESK